MLSETFFSSVLARPKAANTAIAKDVGIYVHELQPNTSVKASFKKSSTNANGLAATSTHIFAAQAEKAVVHVYSRERGNQEALISFAERIHSLTCYGDSVVVLGTSEGRIILWEAGALYFQIVALANLIGLHRKAGLYLSGAPPSSIMSRYNAIPSSFWIRRLQYPHLVLTTATRHRLK